MRPTKRRQMRALTVTLAVLGVLGSCRGREEPESPEDAPDIPAEVVSPAPDAPAVMYGESISTEQRSSTASNSSIEIDYRGWSEEAPRTDSSRTVGPSTRCCRTCRTGKACGNTCIAADRVCRAAPGCACDG